jgi:protease-4
MNFIKNVLASMLGTFAAFFLVIVLFVIMIAVAAAGGEDKVSVKDNSVLHLKLNQAIVDRASKSDFNFGGSGFSSESKLGLNQLYDALEAAKTDDKIKGLFLEVELISAAPSTMLDVRNALLDFKNSGKWIIAYGENYSQGGYYIASAANEVYMFPTGTFDWRGLSTELMFFKKMFDKLEIEAQVIRGPNNKFKSAVEPFMYEQMTPENRQQISTYVGDIWKTMLEGISKERNVSIDFLNQAADSISLMDNDILKNSGLVNGLVYRDEIISNMKGKLGMAADGKDEIDMIDLDNYMSTLEIKDKKDNQIAVVYAEGAIESGEGDDETIGSDRIAKALKDARENEKVKAIVFRVNSPGGSALASDVIWRETELIKKSGKPLIVSMGDYAASGGYYISCSADRIFANPNTITGSIGVFGVIPNMQKFLNNKIGLTFDTYETNAHSDALTVTKPLDEYEMKVMESMVAQIYDDFTSKVAAGRKKTQAQVDSIGQGRVWSGEDALGLGLVDELGDMRAAIKYAAQMAGVSDYSTTDYPKMKDPFEEFVADLTGQKEASIMKEVLGDEFRFYEQFKSIQNIRGIQARLPYFIVIR